MVQTSYPVKTNVLALVGFIAAFIIPLAGLILGVMARRQLNVVGNAESGKGLARWAMVIGMIGTLFQGAFFIVWLSLFATAMSNMPVGG